MNEKDEVSTHRTYSLGRGPPLELTQDEEELLDIIELQAYFGMNSDCDSDDIGKTISTRIQHVLNNRASLDLQVCYSGCGTESINPASNNTLTDEQAVFLLQYAPLAMPIILLLKLMYNCSRGLFTSIVLLLTFVHGNILVKRECAKMDRRSLTALVSELIVTTCSTLLVVYFLVGHDRLLPNVVMFLGYTEAIDVWELIWLVSLTDLIVKIITVDVKILVTATPAVVLPYQKRGKVYLFIESVSQLYRSLLPIQPWLYFLMQSYSGSEKMIAIFLALVYVTAKVVEFAVKLKLFKNAKAVNHGTKPTDEQLRSAGENCPICRDDYSTPVRLGCGHIFCELCICAWLDRKHTCPLCRAKYKGTWLDGSTTHSIQFY